MTDHREQYKDYTYHGGPYDRGGADSYYRRPPNPHKRQGGEEITKLTPEENAAYWAGYWDNETDGHFKDWGRA